MIMYRHLFHPRLKTGIYSPETKGGAILGDLVQLLLLLSKSLIIFLYPIDAALIKRLDFYVLRLLTNDY